MSHRPISNHPMLITYPDCMGNDLRDLYTVLTGPLNGAFSGVHILPFFPSSGDRGFAPITYREVDPRFGTWEDVDRLGDKYYLMYDYMINHLSVRSQEYQDFLQNKDQSPYHDFFIRYKDFWKNGEPTADESAKIYRRRVQGGTYITAHFADGSEEKVWCTFSDEQVDINCQHSAMAQHFLEDNLAFLASHGCSLVRLDAFAYATKKAGTNCFFVEPDVWKLMGDCRDVVRKLGVDLLPEIHENYFTQMKLWEKGYYVYDFQLPMLTLHALFSGQTMYLKNWLRIRSPHAFTTLDTHDGIGVVDVRYLMPDDEVQETKMHVYRLNPEAAKIYTELRGPLNKTFNTYQINCSFFSAVGEDAESYVLARALQLFVPGIPQIYYQGLLAGKNDFSLFAKTREPRDVNRHFYTVEEVRSAVLTPTVSRILELVRLRNTHPAFQGTCSFPACSEQELNIHWKNGSAFAELHINFASRRFTVEHSSN